MSKILTEKPTRLERLTNMNKPVPMKLFAAWEVDRTPSDCIPRWVIIELICVHVFSSKKKKKTLHFIFWCIHQTESLNGFSTIETCKPIALIRIHPELLTYFECLCYQCATTHETIGRLSFESFQPRTWFWQWKHIVNEKCIYTHPTIQIIIIYGLTCVCVYSTGRERKMRLCFVPARKFLCMHKNTRRESCGRAQWFRTNKNMWMTETKEISFSLSRCH